MCSFIRLAGLGVKVSFNTTNMFTAAHYPLPF
jgi:hypothetical protein